MSFLRIWTALLAGGSVAVPATVFYAAARSLLSPASIGRDALSQVFLLAWAIATGLCVLPSKPQGQWLVAIRLTLLLFSMLFALVASTSRAPTVLLVAACLVVLLVLLSHAIAKPAAPPKG